MGANCHAPGGPGSMPAPKRPVGRPPLPSGPLEHLSIRLPRDVVSRYRAEAERSGMALGELLRRAIAAGCVGLPAAGTIVGAIALAMAI